MATVTIPAGVSVSAGQAVTVLSDGLGYPASAAALSTAKVAGVATNNASVGNPVLLETDGYFTNYPTALTPGDLLFISTTSGTISNYISFLSASTAYPSSTVYLSRVGRAVTSSGISIEIENPVLLNNPIS